MIHTKNKAQKDRIENIRRVGEVSKLLCDSGLIVISAFISPFNSDRQLVRELFSKGEFIEIHVVAPLAVCEARDPKGLYVKARQGKIQNFTGIDSVYEKPVTAQVHLKTDVTTQEECLGMIVGYLREQGILKGE